MKTELAVQSVNSIAGFAIARSRVATVLLTGFLLSACGQGNSSDATEPAAAGAPTKSILSGAATNTAQQAAAALEQKAKAGAMIITEATGQPAAESAQARERRLLEASKKTDAQLLQAAQDAGQAGNGQ